MDRVAFVDGVKTALPLLPGIVPFALITGVTAVDVGLSLPQAVGLSVVVFAGASQLAAMELLGDNSPLLIVVGTAVIINLRLVMYSASIAPHFREFSARTKALASYLLTDQAFALSVAKYAESPDVEKVGYYFGVALALWVVWQIGTVAGLLLGTGVPASWGLSFAVPLVFLAILVPAVTDRPTVLSAGIGGGVALAGAGLPYNLGLIVGAVAGVAGGVLAESALGVDPSAEVDRGH